MTDEYIIGIDSGTQSTRAILFNLKGQKIASGCHKHSPLMTEEHGLTVHDYDDVYEGLCLACQDLFSKTDIGKDAIKAVGIASQRATVFFMDKDQKHLLRPISWMDRTWCENEPFLKNLEEKLDPWQYFLANYSRMNWLKRCRPDLFEKVDKYITTAGYLNYKLTGSFTDTLGNNLGMPVDREKWGLYGEDIVYESMGLCKEQMSSFVEPGKAIGQVTKHAALETGLPEGCMVVAGAGDKQCEILGAGTIHKRQAYITMGTMTGLNLVDDHYIKDQYQMTKHRTYTASVPGLWNAEASSPRGFWLVSWFRDNFGGEFKNLDRSIEEYLDEEAAGIPAGAEGLVIIPDWKATWDKPYAKGTFIGFDMRHNRPHVFRALLEGIMMQLKIGTDEMCQETGIDVKEILIGGGGSNSKVAVQAVADIFNTPVKKSDETETCSLGAAICAAVGAGCFSDFREAVDCMGQNHTLYLPIADNHEIYTELIDQIMKPFYGIAEPLLKRLTKIYS